MLKCMIYSQWRKQTGRRDGEREAAKERQCGTDKNKRMIERGGVKRVIFIWGIEREGQRERERHRERERERERESRGGTKN